MEKHYQNLELIKPKKVISIYNPYNWNLDKLVEILNEKLVE